MTKGAIKTENQRQKKGEKTTLITAMPRHYESISLWSEKKTLPKR